MKAIKLISDISYVLIFIFLLFFIQSATFAQEIDILLKGGHVIDPKNIIDTKMDVAIAGGKILQVAPDIPEKNAKKVVDVSGMYVTPGLIDMHVHVFQGTDLNSMEMCYSSPEYMLIYNPPK